MLCIVFMEGFSYVRLLGEIPGQWLLIMKLCFAVTDCVLGTCYFTHQSKGAVGEVAPVPAGPTTEYENRRRAQAGGLAAAGLGERGQVSL